MPIRIEDPFRDPTLRLRKEVNPYVERLIEGSADGSLQALYGPQLKGKKGEWLSYAKTRTGRSFKQLIVEVGSHKGEVLIQMAAANPETFFLGLDITFKRVVGLADRAAAEGLDNVLALLCNGRALTQIFNQAELAGMIVFFPDPWIKKKRQQKNRLVDENFLSDLAEVLAPGGSFWFKTDHRPYFEDGAALADRKFTREEKRLFLAESNYPSNFEKRFTEKNLPTYSGSWRADFT